MKILVFLLLFSYLAGYLATLLLCILGLISNSTKYQGKEIILMLIWAPLLWPYTWCKYYDN